MYKDVTEEFVVNVIKTQTKMIAQIHKELLKIFSSSGNDDLITAATKQLLRQMQSTICTMYTSNTVKSITNGI